MLRAVSMMAVLIFLISGGEAYGAKATSLINVRATILPHLRYRILHEPAALKITNHNTEDKDKRHKDKKKRKLKIKKGTTLSVETNTRDGYVLSVRSLASNVFVLVKIRVEGNGPKFRLSPGGSAEAHIPYSGKSADVITLSYKFYLSSGVKAGSYPWPIIVTVHPL